MAFRGFETFPYRVYRINSANGSFRIVVGSSETTFRAYNSIMSIRQSIHLKFSVPSADFSQIFGTLIFGAAIAICSTTAPVVLAQEDSRVPPGFVDRLSPQERLELRRQLRERMFQAENQRRAQIAGSTSAPMQRLNEADLREIRDRIRLQVEAEKRAQRPQQGGHSGQNPGEANRSGEGPPRRQPRKDKPSGPPQ